MGSAARLVWSNKFLGLACLVGATFVWWCLRADRQSRLTVEPPLATTRSGAAKAPSLVKEWRKVRWRMTRRQVQEIMGPSEPEWFGTGTTIYTWEDAESNTFSVLFVGADRMLSKSWRLSGGSLESETEPPDE
jgi:hypothetical protein